MKYSIEEFSEMLCKRVGELLGDAYEVSVENVLKNNSCEHYGIVVRNLVSDGEADITPALYIEPWYERYLNGESEDKIEEELMESYRTGISNGRSIMLDNISKAEAGDRLFYRLVNKERNRCLLAGSPYVEFLDFAVTFHYLCNEGCDGIQSFRITNKILSDWGLDAHDLFEMADGNMERLFPEKIQGISEIMAGIDEDAAFWDERITVPIYVLTNRLGINGATALVYSRKIKELADMLNEDMYVLPSSIHEGATRFAA